jgi:hypothetical protein
MNDQDLTKTDYDPDRSLVLIEGLSHFLTNFLQNLASCQTSLTTVQDGPGCSSSLIDSRPSINSRVHLLTVAYDGEHCG